MRKIMLFACLLAFSGLAMAEPGPTGLAVEMYIGDWADSLVFAGGVQSPMLFDAAALRAEAAIVMAPLVEGATEGMVSYPAFRLGLAGYSGMSGDIVRLYGVGGITIALPNDKLSDKNWVFGGWGGFGFEFFARRSGNEGGFCYWIELGTNGMGAKTDALPVHAMLLNGFSTQVGMRWYL